MAKNNGKKPARLTGWVETRSNCWLMGGLFAHAMIVPADGYYLVSVFSFGHTIVDEMRYFAILDAKDAAEKAIKREEANISEDNGL